MMRDRGDKEVFAAITAIGPMGGINEVERPCPYHAALNRGRGAR